MPLVVGVHGIGQQFKGPNVLRSEWLPPLRDGLALANAELPRDTDLVCAFYGDLFRPPGMKAVGLPQLDADDIDDGLEQDLLNALWREAARVEPGHVPTPDPEVPTKGRTPGFVQRALDALSHSMFLAGVVERAFIFDLKQVSGYLGDPEIRQAARARIAAVIGEDTRVIVAHSLGTVVAYECLCAHPEWPVRTLVTLGSPLGIRNPAL
jgi:hypothetical protein